MMKKKNICKAYKNRPFECRVYPLLIHHNGQEIIFRLDNKFYVKTKQSLPQDIKNTKKDWLKQKLSLNWIKAYSTIH
jgi:Fe-S-cluster containining protein